MAPVPGIYEYANKGIIIIIKRKALNWLECVII